MFILKLMGRAGIYMNQAGDDGSAGGGGGGGGGGGAVAPEVQAMIDAAVNNAVTGLKSKNQELLGTLKSQKETLAKFDGIDPEAVRGILSKFANDEEAGLIAAGKIDEVLNKRTERMKAGYEKETQAERQAREAAEARANKFSQRVLENAIRAQAGEAGIHPHAVEDALFRAKGTFVLDEDGNAVASEGAFGKDGKPLTLKEWFGDMKEKAPHWFPASGSGGGAQQTKGGSSNGKTITRAQFDALSPIEQAKAVREKTLITD